MPYNNQGCGSLLIFYGFGSGSSILAGSRAFMTKNWKKLQLKFFFIFLGSKTAIYLSLGLHKVCPSYRRSLQLSRPSNTSKHELLQIFVYFCGSFMPSWIRIRIRIHRPDWIRIQSGSGSATLITICARTRQTGLKVRGVFKAKHCIL